ncbi:uncharacterized protein EURHEDRAFT_547025 [Aspergillus ruber CBS 135680]|uniref:Uncharacterized protein n=1 Tax=Aspergillus ruber (strain CBS 135680) TaxID=1388766 RepID=A0A017S2Z2_ASPRC|nr:uncharacterized protein EURHEDRAFT_547025 [Aspergillus ruber CBS 135680]EYE91322.1 hypothetical protein EURHEDRAFT_547025 [Aspergillus ruber CBS 135680]
MYNSAVFSALGTHDYGVFLKSADFDFNNPSNDDYASCSEQHFHMNVPTFYSEASNTGQNGLGNWSASSIPWSVPLLNVTLLSDIPYNFSFNVNRDNIATDHSVLGDKEDLSSLIDILQRYPQANELQQYLNDATRWKSNSWAKNIEVHDTGSVCYLETEPITPCP